jgi:hypothetical protein
LYHRGAASDVWPRGVAGDWETRGVAWDRSEHVGRWDWVSGRHVDWARHVWLSPVWWRVTNVWVRLMCWGALAGGRQRPVQVRYYLRLGCVRSVIHNIGRAGLYFRWAGVGLSRMRLYFLWTRMGLYFWWAGVWVYFWWAVVWV